MTDIIHVDRIVQLTYPNWVAEVVHPELETVGPAKYDLAKVEQFLHDGQKDGRYMNGNALYDYLKQSDSLKNCLGLHDAMAIRSLGVKVFRLLFQDKAVFCWKSVVRDCDGNLRVPCVCEFVGELVVDWNWFNDRWHDSNPSLRFAS